MTSSDESESKKELAARAHVRLARVREELHRCVVGQGEVIDAMLAVYAAGGHLLLEGVPGVAKTLVARSFAAALGEPLSRIQFTPDLMPADVLGTNVYDARSGGFTLLRGPIFHPVVMADEINRTPPKTQAALLEAMQERQVTIDGTSLPLDPSFFVVATQNPLEFEGVYPLPEAQLDRFLLKVEMGLPGREAEVEILRRAVAGELAGWSEGAAEAHAVLERDEARALRQASRSVHVDPILLGYLADLAAAVRKAPQVELGPSPRAVLALLEVARSTALLEERDYVVPDDVKRFLVACWGHRLLLAAEAELEGLTPRLVLERVAAAVEVPH